MGLPEWIGVIGLLIVGALVLIGWHSRGWRGYSGWYPYQDGITEVRKWINDHWSRRRNDFR